MSSFSNEVKRELSSIPSERCCLKAELYSFIRLRSHLTITNDYMVISFATTQIAAARRIMFLLRKIYDVKVNIQIKKKNNIEARSSYYWLNVKERSEEILKDLAIIDSDNNLNGPQYYFYKDCCKASLLRGAFLAKGSINNPHSKDYHLEITTPSMQEAVFLQDLLKEIDIEARTIKRANKGTVLYIKKGEQIADFLKFVGASNSLFAFEDIRIKKDLNNYVNRIMNCDVANEQKAIASAAKQLKNSEYLEKYYGLLNLTPRLVDAIILRTSFPDDSLSQLSDKSSATVNRYISKSGLSHCFKDIEQLVNKIKNK